MSKLYRPWFSKSFSFILVADCRNRNKIIQEKVKPNITKQSSNFTDVEIMNINLDTENLN